MPLSPQEQAELDALEQQYGNQSSSGLSPEEQVELQQLEAQDNQQPQQSNSEYIKWATGQPNQYQPSPDELQRRELSMGVGQNAALGAAVGGVAPLLKPLTKPLGKAADYLMQRAMGMKKVVPGAGTTALEEGIWGTRTGMQKSMGEALEKHGGQLTEAVSKIKQPVPTTPAANALLREAEQFQTKSGIVPSDAQPFLDKALTRAAEAESRGALPATEQLELKRILQKRGYKNGEPLSRFEAQLSQKEALGIGEALEQAAAAEGRAGSVAGPNKVISKLMQGERSLNAPDRIRGPSPFSLTDLLTLGGTRSPLAQSSAAKLINPTGSVAKPTTNALMQLLSTRKQNNE